MTKEEKLTLKLNEAFNDKTGRYFICQISKNQNRLEFYLHEPVLEYMTLKKENIYDSKRFGFYIQIQPENKKYEIYIGFCIVHAKNIASIFGKNIDERKIKELKKLFKNKYQDETSIFYYSSKKKYKKDNESKGISHVKNETMIEEIYNDYPITNIKGTGKNKEKSSYGGSYFMFYNHYKQYNSMTEIFEDIEKITEELIREYCFLYNALFPSKVIRERPSTHLRVYEKFAKENEIEEKYCRIDGCETMYDEVEIHHINPYTNKKDNRITNLIPICGNHHKMLHKIGGTTEQKIDDGYLIVNNEKIKIETKWYELVYKKYKKENT